MNGLHEETYEYLERNMLNICGDEKYFGQKS
jgi:hypothetical protein